jgi:hypothetical protein
MFSSNFVIVDMDGGSVPAQKVAEDIVRELTGWSELPL